jgi:HEAT repeat protein
LNETSTAAPSRDILAPRELEAEAAAALVEIGDSRAILPLLRAADARDANAQIKSCADAVWKQVRDSEVLNEALQEPSYAIRGRAVDELGKRGDVRAIQPLLQALSDPNLEGAAEQALARIGAPAVEPLLAALKHGKPKDRYHFAIMDALGATKDHRATTALIPYLQVKGSDFSTPALAARALGKTGDPLAVAPLISAMEGGLNTDAQSALVEIGPPAIPALLDGLGKSGFAFHSSADTLGRIGKPAVGPLIQKFDHSSGPVRMDAARALSEIDDAEANAALSTAISGGDLTLVAAAHRFLVRRGDPQSRTLLIAALNAQRDPDMAESLINCGDPSLEDKARMWVKRHGYQVLERFGGGGGPKWGAK